MGSYLRVYEDCILFNLGKAYQRVQAEFKSRFLQKFGLTPMQLLVLEVLYDEEGLSAGEIAGRLVLDNATLSGVLDRLVEGGWIIKDTAHGDRRALKIQLTEKGRGMKDSIIDEVRKANEQIMSSFRVEENMLLRRLLKDLRR